MMTNSLTMLYVGLVIFIGGGLGSVTRWLISIKLNPLLPHLPLGTLLVNWIGALIIGLTMASFHRFTYLDPMWKMLITTGFCGGLTTFSTFSVENFYLLQEGRIGSALLNIALNLFGSLIMTAIAFQIVHPQSLNS